ncbi:MAG: hypothetical protein HC880_18220 [Bacteroidia bacterium]|nr:hypothetical protein [Bacteroidia bacterium]
MKTKEKMADQTMHTSAESATCPICQANAVQACKHPENDECPRQEDEEQNPGSRRIIR